MNQPLVAVITGDLVGSSRHPADRIDAAMQAIQNTASLIGAWQTPPQDTRFTRFRGDGWQICLAQTPALCLRAALVISAALRAAELGITTRLSIATGTVESLGTRDLSDATGEAFHLSGRQLDRMPRSGQIELSGRAIGDRDQIIARLMFERASRWTVAQAEALALYMHPDNPTLVEIGARLGITPQAVNYRLGGGGATRLRTTLGLWEEVMEEDYARARP
jgi:hypothetical protein